MAKITMDFRSKYSAGDVVVFEKGDRLMVGIVVGINFDMKNDNPIWYNIAVNKKCTYSFGNGGDVAEEDILGKIGDDTLRKDAVRVITGGL